MLLWWIVGIAAIAICATIYAKGKSNPYKPNLEGKVVVVSGGTAGIGKETAKELARLGAQVVITGRDQEKAEKIIKELEGQHTLWIKPIKPMIFEQCDLTDLIQVAALAKRLKEKFAQIDILVNNAATMEDKMQRQKQGIEKTMGVNHIAPMYLTHLLMSSLLKSSDSRIVTLSSAGYKMGMILQTKKEGGGFDACDFLLDNLRPEDFSSFHSYAKSKLGNVFFTQTLSSLLKKKYPKGPRPLTACLHPGVINTEITRNLSSFWQIVKFILTPLMKLALKTELEGAQCTLTVCCMPRDKLERHDGEYFSNCVPTPLLPPAAAPKSDSLRELVWELSREKIKQVTGEDVFSSLL